MSVKKKKEKGTHESCHENNRKQICHYNSFKLTASENHIKINYIPKIIQKQNNLDQNNQMFEDPYL